MDQMNTNASAMSDQRKRTIALKIKALLAKTTESGCTEAEALEAAAKAAELLHKYQLDLSELDLREEGTAEAAVEYDDLARALAGMVAKYCECKVWGEPRKGKMKFLGLTSDAWFAEWLMLALTAFVKRKGLEYSLDQRNVFQSDITDFRFGCINRINERLKAEIDARKAEAQGATGRALIVLKDQLVTEAWVKKNLNLRSSNWRHGGTTHSAAYASGYAKGGDARFARPVERHGFEQRKLPSGGK